MKEDPSKEPKREETYLQKSTSKVIQISLRICAVGSEYS